ncbi:cytochrome P450 monooxygenase CYP63 [Neolentinus lepideus HHB14362 ss-1]|uniref:Cytochrome P450 monooxygenase CYP63 n=1 Tax=Neolentinus lepideus HHB14362 ss-1 TaxID=1314782 RepID=A0A165VV59_9AGAM|nr:cytochrome P450 monooxygenase CYP63 [Neolentinus lepideus HHB14362 ss-1]
MHPTQYRTRILLDVVRVLVVPSAILSLYLQLSGTHLGPLGLPCHAAFIIVCAYTRCLYSDWVQSMDAKRLGAKPIPRVVGKLPGNIDVLYKMMKAFKTAYILDVYLALFEEYQCTTLNTRILWVDQIITMDEEHSKFVIATGFHHFWRGKLQKERMERFLGNGIFNRDDEMWKMHRSMARPFFARDRISDFELYEKHAQRLLSIVSSTASSNLACDVQDLYSRFTMDSASEFLFGENFDTLSGSRPEPGKATLGAKGSALDDDFGTFAQAFEECQQVITTRARLGYTWPLHELWEDKTLKPVQRVRKWLDPIVQRVLDDKARMRKAGILSPVGEKNFLQHLADSTDDPSLIRDQLLSMLLAARDTSACLLTFVTYFMAMHPEVTRRLRAEVLHHCGPTGIPTYENIRNLRYMRAVIHETLRLFPPVPLNIRESRATACALPPSDGTYSGTLLPSQPLYMPAKTNIVYLPLLTHRNPALWGPDADNFDPERWLDPERLNRYTSNPMMYTPFSAGPRVCVGQNYALNEASYLLVRLLQQVDHFSFVPECQPAGSLPPPEWKSRRGRQAYERVWPAAALTLYAKGGLWVRFGQSLHP